jgi:hypothetical protein
LLACLLACLLGGGGGGGGGGGILAEFRFIKEAICKEKATCTDWDVWN